MEFLHNLFSIFRKEMLWIKMQCIQLSLLSSYATFALEERFSFKSFPCQCVPSCDFHSSLAYTRQRSECLCSSLVGIQIGVSYFEREKGSLGIPYDCRFGCLFGSEANALSRNRRCLRSGYRIGQKGYRYTVKMFTCVATSRYMTPI